MASHKAYVQKAAGEKMSVEIVPTPTPAAGEVLVEVLASPLFSYMKDVLKGGFYPLVYPLTPGLPTIARVVATGPDATNLKKDQLVLCNPTIRARDDPTGGTAILQGLHGGGTPDAMKLMEGCWRDGAWAEKMLAPTENLTPVNEEILIKKMGYTIPQLCWANAFLVPLGGWLAAGLKAGDTVIVAPATGHLGGAAVRVALAMGARTVIAGGRKKQVLEKLTKIDGGNRVQPIAFSGDVGADSKALRDATPAGKGADIYLDFSPPQAGKSTHPQACVGAVKHGGQVILMGGVTENISFNYAQLTFGNISVRGNFMFGPEAPGRLLGLMESGLLSLKGLETEVFGFEKIEEGVDFAAENDGAEKIVLASPVEF